jgi:hypothetical protein
MLVHLAVLEGSRNLAVECWCYESILKTFPFRDLQKFFLSEDFGLLFLGGGFKVFFVGTWPLEV